MRSSPLTKACAARPEPSPIRALLATISKARSTIVIVMKNVSVHDEYWLLAKRLMQLLLLIL
jgi:hypothetical protein